MSNSKIIQRGKAMKLFDWIFGKEESATRYCTEYEGKEITRECDNLIIDYSHADVIGMCCRYRCRVIRNKTHNFVKCPECMEDTGVER